MGGAAMATMCKCVQQAMQTNCFQTCHFRELNPHLENSQFDSFFVTDVSRFPYRQGNPHASSFGFGGSNGHVIFWGDSIVETSVNKQILKKLASMAHPEVRPIGDDP